MTADVQPVRIYLSGFMGAGKSTVGAVLADRLDWPFKDLDDVIEREEGRSIPEIFEQSGEAVFRDLETRHLDRLSRRDPPFVLAVGGGAPVQERNRTIMEETGLEVFLHVPFPVAFRRIQEDEHRPLVPDGPGAERKLRELWESRRESYLDAEWVVECNDDDPESIAQRIDNRLREDYSEPSG